jgi:hypothetical protein
MDNPFGGFDRNWYNPVWSNVIMFGLFGRKEEEEEQVIDPKEEVRKQLQVVSDNAALDRDTLIGNMHDALSLVCFVNEDMPQERQVAHIGEAIADFLFFEGQHRKAQEWHERSKAVGKKDKILVFKVPAEDMIVLYQDHLKLVRAGKRSALKSVSAIVHSGKSYPVSFVLGFIWGHDAEQYNMYESFTI